MRKLLVIIGIVGVFFGTGAFGQDAENIELITRISGNPWNDAEAVEVVDEIAYVADADSGIRVVDISNPISPVEMSLIRYTPIVYSIETLDYDVYLATEEGLVIIDIVNPAEAQIITIYSELGEARGMFVSDDIAYAALGRNGVAILDIGDPDSINVLSQIDTPGFAINIEKDGNHIFVADRSGGMRIINVEDPEQPEEISSLESEGEIRDIAVSGNEAFLAESNVVSRVDISNLAEPGRTHTFRTGGVGMVIDINENLITVLVQNDGLVLLSFEDEFSEIGEYDHNSSPTDFTYSNNMLFLVGRRWPLTIIDATDPEELIPVGGIGRPITYNTVSVSGNYAYIGTYPYGVLIYDVSDPLSPELIWRDDLLNSYYCSDLEIENETLFSAGIYREIRIGSLVEPGIIQWIGQIRSDESELTINDNLLCTWSPSYSNIGIYDISDLDSPDPVTSIYGGRLRDFWLDNDLTIVTQEYGYKVINISDLFNIREIATYESDDCYYSMARVGNYAFFGRSDVLEIVDLSDPRNAVILGSCQIPSNFYETKIFGNHAYLSCEGDGFYMVDINDPESPNVVGFYNTEDRALSVEVSGIYAYVADCNNLSIYNISEALSAPKMDGFENLTFSLQSAYPNPFNSSTMINFTLPVAGDVSLRLYSSSGRSVSTLYEGYRLAGMHECILDAGGLSSGVYYISVSSSGISNYQPINLIK